MNGDPKQHFISHSSQKKKKNVDNEKTEGKQAENKIETYKTFSI